jgi:hypothetical protein
VYLSPQCLQGGRKVVDNTKQAPFFKSWEAIFSSPSLPGPIRRGRVSGGDGYLTSQVGLASLLVCTLHEEQLPRSGHCGRGLGPPTPTLTQQIRHVARGDEVVFIFADQHSPGCGRGVVSRGIASLIVTLAALSHETHLETIEQTRITSVAHSPRDETVSVRGFAFTLSLASPLLILVIAGDRDGGVWERRVWLKLVHHTQGSNIASWTE